LAARYVYAVNLRSTTQLEKHLIISTVRNTSLTEHYRIMFFQ